MFFRQFYRKLDAIHDMVSAILLRMERKISEMARTLDETLAAVTAESTKTDSIIALLSGIEQQLKDALAGTTLTPETQAKVDAIFDAATASSAKIDAAIAAGTPPAPPPPTPAPAP